MLAMADVDINRFIPVFAQAGVPVAFLVPTPTGYGKSIMDATSSVRRLFLEKGIHDYSIQEQGTINRKLVRTHLVTENAFIETVTSLYRPVTKMGDPRLWIYGLQRYCNPCNLLALIIIEGDIYVFNLSNNQIANSLLNHGHCAVVLEDAIRQENQVADELLDMIRRVHNRGFIPSVTRGDPGVGDTLENALGIGRNNRQIPDYNGIELKASRNRINTPNRCTLFDKTPDWSRGMSERDILDNFGYWGTDDNGNNRFQLYCTMKAGVYNPQGLSIGYNEPEDSVDVDSTNTAFGIVTGWDMEVLRNRLLEKHPATFWVKASVDYRDDGWEMFRYDYIKYTRNPNVALFSNLIDEGIVTVDFTMHRKPNGAIRDHGFPFKIYPTNINLLFPEVVEYDLTV